MIVHQVLLEVNEANAFVAACEETREAILVDAGEFNPGIAQCVESNAFSLVGILITHDHYDHTSGLKDALAYAGDLPVYAFQRSIEGIETSRLAHGDVLRVGALEGQVFHTPGHTFDGISVAFPGHCFTGDALFAGSVGGTGTPEDYAEQLEAIRNTIFTLPPSTRLYTGHGPPSTVAIESRYNPFFV